MPMSPEYPDTYHEREGGYGMNKYEAIGVVLGVVIFAAILLAGVVVGGREHA